LGVVRKSKSSRSDSISVKYTKLTYAIAAKSAESRALVRSLKRSNQTLKNKASNSGGTDLELALRPIWQGRWFWDQTFDSEVVCDIREIKELIDSGEPSALPINSSKDEEEA